MPEFRFPVIGHGGDYNPDQWLDRPDVLEQDVALMREARCNLMSVGIFAWSALEPREGEYSFAWLRGVLDRLHAAGVQLAVLTNKDHVSAAPLIEKYFGSERFALVQGRVDAFPPKPEAPVTLHVMEELGANPATTLYVGDSNVDILTGHNAGLKSAGVSWGFRGRAELEAAGADYVVDTQGELAARILGE